VWTLHGIYFINDKIQLNGLSREESFHLQEQALLPFIGDKKIQIVTLNQHQLNSHYTILHALLHDLKKQRVSLDCLVYYCPCVLEDFTRSYPARWLILKSYFHHLLPVQPSGQEKAAGF
jgi:hypothetical protein